MSDSTHSQSDVEANVTAYVISLSPRDVMDATPLTLAVDSYRVVQQEGEVRRGERKREREMGGGRMCGR